MSQPTIAEPKAPKIPAKAAESAPEPTSAPSPYEAACLEVARREQADTAHADALRVERDALLAQSRSAATFGDNAGSLKKREEAFRLDAEVRRLVNTVLPGYAHERERLVNGTHPALVRGTVEAQLGGHTKWEVLARLEKALEHLITDEMREVSAFVVQHAHQCLVRPSAIAQALADASTATAATPSGLMKTAQSTQSLLAR